MNSRAIRKVNLMLGVVAVSMAASSAACVAQAELLAGGVPTPAKLTVGDLLGRWLERTKDRVEPATFASYSR